MFPLYSGSFKLSSPYKHAQLRLQAGHLWLKHTTPATWKKHTKKPLSKRTLQAAVFEEAETKAFATSAVFRGSPGHETKRQFSLGNSFFSPFCISLRKGWLCWQLSQDSSAQADEAQMLVPCFRRLCPPLCCSIPGQWPQGIKYLTEVQQGRTSLESNMISNSSCGWGLGSLPRKALFFSLSMSNSDLCQPVNGSQS